MAVDLVLASTASALALSASAAAAAADQDWQDEEFKLGGGKYERNTGPTVAGMPVWAVAMLATVAACLLFLLLFCCARCFLRRVKGGQGRQQGRARMSPSWISSLSSPSRNASPAAAATSVSVGDGSSFQCHLCLGKVGRRKWEGGAHRRKCADANRAVLDRLPAPFDVCCGRCGELLRQWPRRGPPFRCGGGRGCPMAMGGRPLAVDNNGANRFCCFLCNFDLCRSCVQRKVRKRSEAVLARSASREGEAARDPKYEDTRAKGKGQREPDLLQVREPSLRRLKLEYSDVANETETAAPPMSASRQDAPGESAPSAAPTSSPRILVTAPTNQDLLDHVMMEKRRQHRPPVHRRASAASTSASAGGTAAIVSRTSSVVAMTPSLMIRTPLSSQQQQQGLPSPPSGQVSGETSVHSSLMSADFSAVQVSPSPGSPEPLLPNEPSEPNSRKSSV